MKKRIVSIAVIICVILGYFVYDQTKFKEEDIVLKFNDMKTVEYGQTLDPMSLIQYCSGEVTCQESVDSYKVGKQTLMFVVKEEGITKEFGYEIEVKDTVSPIITLLKDEVIIKYGEKFDAQKNIKSVQDKVDGDIPYSQEIKNHSYTIESHVDSKKSGHYEVKIKAIDKNGNQSEKTYQVKVEKENVQPKPEKPSTPESKPDIPVTKPEVKPNPNNKVIVINPGHQGKGNSGKEAVGPGSSTMKAKVSAGATGVSSKIAESQINLTVGLKLKAELETRGYTVVMTRTSQNVNMSNQERAKLANKYNAAAVISLHCDGGNASARGAHTIAIAKNNPYCPQTYNTSSSLASHVIKAYCQETGIKNRGVSYRNDLTGLNWSEVPSIYLEMGFLSNKDEDLLLTNASFQNKMIKGIANGIDKYFK